MNSLEPLADAFPRRLFCASAEERLALFQEAEAALVSLWDKAAELGADETSLWIADGEGGCLEALWHAGRQGGHGDAVLGFRQPLDRGFISMVFLHQQAFSDHDIAQQAQHDVSLDQVAEVTTHSMLALPFGVEGDVLGVWSLVVLKPGASVFASNDAKDAQEWLQTWEVSTFEPLVEQMMMSLPDAKGGAE